MMRHWIKCPMGGFRPGCQKLHDPDNLTELREHIIANHCHPPIFDYQTGSLNKEELLNIYWLKKCNYDDLESEVRKYLFKACTFGTVQPNPLDMMPQI